MKIKIYKSGIHLGEERLIVGNHNSGMISFSGCHLQCNFCYTPETSVFKVGDPVTPEEFRQLIEELLVRGARNINLISPTHVWPWIKKPLQEIKEKYGARVPILLKISGYELPRAIASFQLCADVFVPDFKLVRKQAARQVGLPPNYGSIARRALKEMAQTHGKPVWTSEGKLARGILVRHLLMPDFFEESLAVMQTLQEDDFQGVINLMTYFVDPNTHQLLNANPAQVEVLTQIAKQSGLRVLVNGKDTTRFCSGSRKGAHAVPA